MSQKIERGDVVLIRFPFTDLSGSKRRPAVILATYLPDVIVAFISSVVPTMAESSDVLLQPTSPSFAVTGLKKASVIRLRKIATLEQALITRWIGRLDQSLLTAVDKALLKGLGIDEGQITDREYQRLLTLLHDQGETAVVAYIHTRTHTG